MATHKRRTTIFVMMTAAAALLCSAAAVSGFLIAPTTTHLGHQPSTRATPSPLVPSRRGRACSSLSDVAAARSRGAVMSTAEVMDVVGEDAPVTEPDAKTNLLKRINLRSSGRMRTEVNELMLKLEPMNPTDQPARSPVLNGVWEFLYTGGMSPGPLAVQVLSRVAKTFSAVVDLEAITLTISRSQPRVEAAVKASVLGTQAQVKVRTRLEQKSDMRLQEVYEEAEVAGVTIPIPARIQPRRTLYITYLDRDIMIARDETGAPDLLIRKQKDFRFNDGTPSTSEDDDSSPGSG